MTTPPTGPAGDGDQLREADAVLEALAVIAEAEQLSIVRRVPIPGTYLVEEGMDVAAWLRGIGEGE